MNAEQRRRLTAAVYVWSKNHPAPDRPVFGFAGNELLSPRELAVALAESTPDGERFFHAVRYVLEVISLREFVSVFGSETELGTSI